MKPSACVTVFFTLLLTCMFAMPANSAHAHRLNVFAWLENNEIIVECDYGNKKPAIGAQVTILDKNTGQTLTKGVTDNSGHFIFNVPQVVRDGHTLAIDVNSGDGHRSEWVMPASELYAAASLSAGFDQEAVERNSQARAQTNSQAQPQARPQMKAPAPAIPQVNMARPGALPGPENLRMMIRDEMEQQLAPIRRTLASQKSGGPSVTEIIGGLGWIAGIVGIVLFFLSRRKPQA